QARETVADRRPAGTAEVDRARRVRRDELEVDRHPRVEITAAEVVALLDDRPREGAGGRGVEGDVEETRAGDVDRGDSVCRGERRRELRREVARVEPETLAQFHRDVRGPVAMIAVARTLESDVVGRDLVRPL